MNNNMEWRPIETAPYNTPVWVSIGDGMTIVARLVPDASMSDIETTCDQWQAEFEGCHPPCWTDGACWGSNEDQVQSMQPKLWHPLLEGVN